MTNEDTVFYFRTNLKAPRNKVIRIDIKSPDMVPLVLRLSSSLMLSLL